MTKKKPEEEKIAEWFGEWIRRRNENWGKRTKVWFGIVIIFTILSFFNPASTMVIIIYFLFGAAVTLWLVHITNDEKLTIRKKKEKSKGTE